MSFLIHSILLISITWISFCKGVVPGTLVFPDVFSAQVEADFMDDGSEADVELYFDRETNIAAVHYLYQNEQFINIYNFADDYVISIKDLMKCDITNISKNQDELFFPYEIDPVTKKKLLSSSKKFFRFPDVVSKNTSTDDGIPLNIYTEVMDLPFYQRKECEVKYMFTKNTYTMANCEFGRCNSTLLAISLKCLDNEEGDGDLDELFRFFKFENHIPDDTVFKVPPGIFCNIPKSKPFPMLPKMFKFFYDVTETELDVTDVQQRTRRNRKSVSYVSGELFAVDHFKDSTLTMRKICDMAHNLGYVIDPRDGSCTKEACIDKFNAEKASQLPAILFPVEGTNKNMNEPVYLGTRLSNDVIYDVWSSNESESSLYTVRDFYFVQDIAPNSGKSDKPQRLSHILEYTYQKDSETKQYQLLKTTSTIANHFSNLRDWESIDLGICYSNKEKMEFELQFAANAGLPVVESFPLYKQFIDSFSNKLLSSVKISTTRLTEIKAVPGSDPITFRGAILEDPVKLGYTNTEKTKELSMKDVFSLIQNLVNKKELSFTISTDTDVTHTFNVAVFREPENSGLSRNYDDGTFYTPGAMAGLGVAMCILGLMIGGIVILIYMKSRRSFPEHISMN